MAKKVDVVVTGPEHHYSSDNTPSWLVGVYSVFVDGPCCWHGDLGETAKWLVNNVPDDSLITFKGFGPKHTKVTGKGFRDVGLDVLLKCL